MQCIIFHSAQSEPSPIEALLLICLLGPPSRRLRVKPSPLTPKFKCTNPNLPPGSHTPSTIRHRQLDVARINHRFDSSAPPRTPYSFHPLVSLLVLRNVTLYQEYFYTLKRSPFLSHIFQDGKHLGKYSIVIEDVKKKGPKENIIHKQKNLDNKGGSF